jgi:hypothetical protein
LEADVLVDAFLDGAGVVDVVPVELDDPLDDDPPDDESPDELGFELDESEDSVDLVSDDFGAAPSVCFFEEARLSVL